MQTNGVLLTPATCDVLVAHDVKVGDLARRRPGRQRPAPPLRQRRRAATARCCGRWRCCAAPRTAPATRASSAPSTSPTTRSGCTRRCWPRSRRTSTSCCRTPTGTTRRPGPTASPPPYADWLLAVHRRWLADGRPVPIRLFESLLSTASGRRQPHRGGRARPGRPGRRRDRRHLRAGRLAQVRLRRRCRPPAWTSSGTRWTTPRRTRRSPYGRPVLPASARPAVRARWSGTAAAGSTPTGTAPATASTTRPSTAPICSSSSGW